MKLLGITSLFLLAGNGLAKDKDNPYVPYGVSCPNVNSFTRRANALSPQEAEWLNGRDKVTKPLLIDWLKESNLTDFDPERFLSNSTIRFGMAFSGGGYRAMLCGAGQMAALDSRTKNSTNPGHMGGLVQASTYMAGLSGGNWLLGSIVVNNFTSVQELQASKDLWNLENSIFDRGGINIFKTLGYWDDIIDDVQAKEKAGWNTSLTDLWGRGLSYQFFNFSRGGRGIRYHYIREYDAFKSHQMPFPIHVADGRAPDTLIISLNSTVFEFNPFELGSWDPSVYTFTDLQYLGSEVSNGKPDGNCTNGYDNVGFLVGTSSSLFNQFFLQLNSTGITGPLYWLAKKLLTDLGDRNDDIAIYEPNPFANIDYLDNSIPSAASLDLVDGGEDNQNVPLHPLIQPQRHVDAIFAFDNSADTYDTSPIGANWANGSSLVATYERQFATQGNNTIFPYVPDTETFVNGGLLGQPTFFGCSRRNLSSLFNPDLPESERNYPPVIIYIPNTLFTYQSNVSTFQMSYDPEEQEAIITNGYNIVTQLNGTLDSSWRSCVACALILREQQRRGEEPTDQCGECLNKYCWDGATVGSSAYTARRDGQNITQVLASIGHVPRSASAKKNIALKALPQARAFLVALAVLTMLL